jgi:hypothetical protein
LYIKKMVTAVLLIVFILSCTGANFIFAADMTLNLSNRTTTSTAAYNYSRSNEEIIQEGIYLSFRTGQWVEYDVIAPEDGMYKLILTIGSPSAHKIGALVNETDMHHIAINSTGGYMNTIPHDAAIIKLKKGKNVVRIANEVGGYYFEEIGFEPIREGSEGSFEKNFGAYKTAILPTIIEAEDFDLGYGGSLSADNTNNGKEYRKDDGIDIYRTSDKKDYYIVLAAGEHTRYTFEVSHSGIYTLYLAAGQRSDVDIYFNDMPMPVITSVQGGVSFPETKAVNIFLPEGEHIVTIAPASSELRLNYIRFGAGSGEHITLESLSELLNEDESGENQVKANPVYKSLYVSENGSDSNTGEKDSPFKTISRAKEETVKLRDNMTGDIIVNIAPGYYQLDKTEVFNEIHGGKNRFNIIYRGTDKFSPPIISGGRRVNGWESVDGVIWRAPLDREKTARNLYVGGLPATRARSKYRYPYLSEYKIDGSINLTDGLTTSAINFPTNLTNIENIELVWDIEWTTHRMLIDEMIVEGEDVNFVMKQPYWSNKTTTVSVTPNIGTFFYIENAKELLDEPGEFYHDVKEQYIYYYPYKAQDLKNDDVFVGDLEFMFNISGSDINNKISNLVFDNLDIRYGAWDQVSEIGILVTQSDSLKVVGDSSARSMMPAQFAVNKAENIQILNSTFTCLGSSAISMVDAVSKSQIEGNLIKDISGTGIVIGTWEHQIVRAGMETCRDIDIRNNVIRRAANEFRHGVGISVYYEYGINIVHNSFIEMPYTALSIGWGWGAECNTCGNINASYNYFEDAVHTLRDGAHLYTLGPSPGSVISNNYFKKSGPGAANYGGVYTDSGSGYFHIINNVYEETPTMWFVGLYHTHDLTADNNYVEAEKTITLRESSNKVTNTHVVKDGNWPDEAVKIMQNAGVEMRYKNLLNKAKAPKWYKVLTKNVPKASYILLDDSWIEAEDFLPGGQNVGYYKINELPNNNTYRPDGVALLENPAGSGYVIHINFPDEWMKYEFEIPNDGTYDFKLKAAQAWPTSEPQPGVRLYIDDEVVIDEALVPYAINWRFITEYSLGKVDLTEGKHTAKLEILNNGFYIDAFKFTEEGAAGKVLENDPNFDEGVIVEEKDPELEEAEVEEEKILFDDIEHHWAQQYIIQMAERNIIKGISEALFAPDQEVTAKQAAWLSLRTLNIEYDEEDWNGTASMLDIQSINPEGPVTREEFISIVMNAYTIKRLTYPLIFNEKAFADMGSVSEEYKIAVWGAKELGLIQGDDDNNFNPKNSLTRAESATILKRLIDEY